MASAVGRVLVAEDDSELRSVFVEALRRDGHDVVDVGDGRALLAAVVDPSVAVVVTDVRMPGISGLQVLERIRPSLPMLPFVFVTAFGDSPTHARARSMRALVLDKPVSMQRLCEAVARALVRRS